MRPSLRRVSTIVCASVVLLLLATQPALAQSGGSGGGGALVDIIIEAFRQLLRALFSPIETIRSLGDSLARLVVGTPHPDSTFSRPSNGPWPNIYDYYWGTIIPLSLSLYGLSIGLVIFFESTSHLFSSYHRSKLKKRAFAGLLGILSWWWMAALSLRFIDALSGFLTPSLSNISWFQTLSFSAIGLIGLVLSWAVDIILFLLIALIYLVRQHALYLYVLLMPLLIVLWIPGVGPFKLVSKFMKKLASFYVPFLFMTVPVALLFRLGDLLGTSAGPTLGGIGIWISALVIPFLALVSPLVLFWQAGALFFIGDRMAHHFSAQRAKNRARRFKQGINTGKQGSRNFVRGLRDEPAITQSGQYVFDSGGSRAHSAGQRLNNVGSRLRNPENGSGGNSGGNLGGGGASSTSETGSTDSGGDAYDRSNQDQFRDPETRDRSRDSADEPPRYIH